MKYSAVRKLEDFEYLYQKLYLINPYIFNPCLPSNLKKEVKSIVLYLNFYMNLLAQSSYFRSLVIFDDFLQLNYESWDKKKRTTYDEIKEPYNKESIYNLEGFLCFNNNLKKEEKELFQKIKDIINHKNDAFNKVNNAINDLLNIMEKMSISFDNLNESLTELTISYINDKDCVNVLGYIDTILKEWGDDYLNKKKYLDDEIKFAFNYMAKENKSFLKYYDYLKSNCDSLKIKMEKIKSNNKFSDYSEKEKKAINKSEKEISFNIYTVNKEYKNLNQRQSGHMEKILFLYCQDNERIINDMNSFYSLINTFKKTKEGEEEEKK